MDWFKVEETKDTPGRALPFYRKLKGLTQPELTEMLGTTKQFISNIENDRKPISKMLATKLGLRSDSTIIIAGSEKKSPLNHPFLRCRRLRAQESVKCIKSSSKFLTAFKFSPKQPDYRVFYFTLELSICIYTHCP